MAALGFGVRLVLWSLLVLPLVCADEAIGTITLAARRRGTFSNDRRNMLGIIAKLMGILPGKMVKLLQSFPSYVFQIGQSQFAVDDGLARAINEGATIGLSR